MKKIKHSWKLVWIYPTTVYQCEKCGCIKHWDFDYNHMMYYWGTNVTYRSPSCIIMNGVPYNPIETQAVKK